MKRILVSFIAVMLGMVGFSQSVIIHFKDGSFEKHKMSLIESIEFVEDNYETTASIYLDKAGTLSSKLSKSQASELLKLKLSGHMDARDFDYIKWDCMKVEEVDLADVVIDSYSGVEGTEEGNNKTYAANEIPSGAFFYWIDSYKYNYSGRPSDEGMPSLKKIILPQGITAIRRNAFARAYNLTEINIPEGVQSIDLVAFNICTSLEELRLPSTLTNVGKWAFSNMSSLKSVYISALVPPTATDDIFEKKPSDAVLYVPNGTENLYKYATGWRNFSNIVGIGETSGNNSNDEKGWKVLTDDFDRTLPFTKIRVLNKKSAYDNYCCISFSTSSTELLEIDKYFINFWTLTIADNISNTISWGNPITNYKHVGENWYEYEFSRPVYFGYYNEYCPRGQVMAYIENNGGGGDDDGGGSTTDGSEYFEITINGEKKTDTSWGGSVLLNLAEKTVNGKKMIPYGSNTDMIRTSDGRAYQFDVFAGYVEDDWFGKGYPKSVGSYDVISSEGEYVVSNYSDNVGMVVSGGGSNNGPSDFVVKSGSLRITKVAKATSNEKYVPDKTELYATEGNFDFILHDNRYDEDIPMSGKFRLIY